MKRQLPRGLYAITDSKLLSPEHLIQAVAQAIQGGAVMIQYRDKGEDAARRLWEAQDLANLCRSLGVPLIINDDVELAAQAMADGVHLGRDDGNVAIARSVLGEQAIIGVSCYNELDLALAAEADGADYVAFGSFYSSSVKPNAVRASTALLAEAKARLSVPVVAIGGINSDNGVPLVAAGADMLAVINAVFGQADVASAAAQITKCFK